MNLNQLSRDIENKIVNNEHGWGQYIEYTYRRDNRTLPPMKAMFLEGGLDSENTDYDTLEDMAIFYSVELPRRPERGDKIVIDGDTWFVDRVISSKPYDIACKRNLNHKTGHSNRVAR